VLVRQTWRPPRRRAARRSRQRDGVVGLVWTRKDWSTRPIQHGDNEPLRISKRARGATQRTAWPSPYSCVSQLSAAAGSMTGSGAFGYPSGSRVTRASHPLASAAAAQTASSKSGQASASARRTTLSSTVATAKTPMRRFYALAGERRVTSLLEQVENRRDAWAGTMPWAARIALRLFTSREVSDRGTRRAGAR
jgi:hypothetical protein